MAENESSTPEQLGDGDGKTTASATPDARNSGTHGVSSQPGRGTVPQPGQSGETFGPAFEGLDKRNPFVEMLTNRIKMKQQSQQEKQSMDLSPHMMRAFQDELVHLRREKQASILAAVGKGVMGLARGGAKGGMRRGLGAGALNMARKAGFRGANATKAVGGAALGAGALGAAGLGAAVAR